MSIITTRLSEIDPRHTTPITVIDFGAIAAADATAFLSGATSSELPNNGSVTYTFPVASADVSPQDGALQTGVIPTPRNIAVAVNTAAAAMTVTLTGTDLYGKAMSEVITIAQNGTTGVGKKAFATLSSVVIASGGNITSNTVSVGTGTKIGLPYLIDRKNHAIFLVDGAIEPQSTGFALTVADTSTASTTTGDVRGTVNFTTANAPNGTRSFAAWLVVYDTSEANTYGVTQA